MAILDGEGADSIRSKINAVLAVSGTYVTLTGSETLTNKNLTSGTNTFPTSLATLTGAQALTNKDLTSGTNTFPTAMVTLTGTQVLTNKDLSSGTNTFPSTLATDAEVTSAIAALSTIYQAYYGVSTLGYRTTIVSSTLAHTILDSDLNAYLSYDPTTGGNIDVTIDNPSLSTFNRGGVIILHNIGSANNVRMQLGAGTTIIYANGLTNTLTPGQVGVFIRLAGIFWLRLQ